MDEKEKWSVKQFLKTKRWVITFGIILFGVLLYVIPPLFMNLRSVNVNASKIEVMYYLSQSIAAMFVITGVVIAGWQYFLTSRMEIANIDIMSIQRAIDLAEYYKDNILELFLAVYYVYEHSGINEILRNIKASDMIRFDETEMRKMLSPGNIEKLKTIQFTDEFIQAVLEANDIYRLNLKIQIKESIDCEEKKKEIKINPEQVYMSFVNSTVAGMLNNMEYFSMNFTHGTADESVVYQSLHQTYLDIVHTVYYNIAKNNVPQESKYYTNVIELYNVWNAKHEKQIECLAKSSDSACEKGKTVR